ncbi:MAG: hypothetical protein ACE5GX_16495 [Thermoanaerobaculia bacterium]
MDQWNPEIGFTWGLSVRDSGVDARSTGLHRFWGSAAGDVGKYPIMGGRDEDGA